jgi:hypothetical protein
MRLTPRLMVGLEFNPVVSELNPIGNWIACLESERTPTVIFGTSSDRIFTPEGNQAFFVSFAKTIPGTPVAVYAGPSYSEFEDKFILPMGANWVIDKEHGLLLMYDGRRTHALVTKNFKKSNLTLMAIGLKRPRLGVSFGWSFD